MAAMLVDTSSPGFRGHTMTSLLFKNRSALRTCVYVALFLLFSILPVEEIKLGCLLETDFSNGKGCCSIHFLFTFFATRSLTLPRLSLQRRLYLLGYLDNPLLRHSVPLSQCCAFFDAKYVQL